MNASDFVGNAKKTTTVSFQLIPQGKTLDYFTQSGLLEQDKRRADMYPFAKQLLDNYYKHQISLMLGNISMDEKLSEALNQLMNALIQFTTNKTSDLKKEIEDNQTICRELFVKKMSSIPEFEMLDKANSKKIIEAAIKWCDIDNVLEEEFNNFAGYFNGYCINRSNLFTSKKIHSSIAFRIINENFSKYVYNILKFKEMKLKYPDLYIIIESNMKEKFGCSCLDQFFSSGTYCDYITQKGIESYNKILGGIEEEKGKAKIQGYNELVNLYSQSHPEVRRNTLVLAPLYKQILSDRSESKFYIDQFTSEQEVKNSIKTIIESGLLKDLARCSVVTSKIVGMNESQIYLNSKTLASVSMGIFGTWNGIDRLLRQHFQDDYSRTNPKKRISEKTLEKLMKSDCFDLSLLRIVLARNQFEDLIPRYTIDEYISKYSSEVISSIDSTYSEYNKLDSNVSFKKNHQALQTMKAFLDAIKDCIHWFKSFWVSDEYDKDVDFYSVFENVYEPSLQFIKLYDKVRNFITKKEVLQKKFKLNFGCPTLADGWDRNKEGANLCYIFIRDGRYYLGVRNRNLAKKEFEFSGNNRISSSTNYYQKMVYKLLPGPSKMLPKVLFPKSKPPVDVPCNIGEVIQKKRAGVIEYWKPEYASKIEWEHKLIEFYQESIPLYGDWKEFGFTFQEPVEYESLEEFYGDILKQNYKVKLQQVSGDQIDELVNIGHLFLFEIYNKDFATGSTGKKNLHTLYWLSIFSEENLASPSLKLNGNAELFYRPPADDRKITHPAGSRLVNRLTKDGQSIPDEIYFHLYEYVNGRMSSISEEELKWYETAIVKTLNHPIIKDKRFYSPQFSFHVPITFNAFVDKSFRLNDRVQEMLVGSDKFHVIGIDRGEKNLLYISVVNQDGDIIYQKSLNDVAGGHDTVVNYQSKLKNAEEQRDKARKSWSTIEKIAELKEGYLSQVVHEISRLMIKYNAIVVLEDLNFGFKRGRFKVERQVYQKFEEKLIKKLNYLVFKDTDPMLPGGVLNGYQLASPFESFEKIGKQTGWLFYVKASYTSKIDPVTGFSNLFQLQDLTNVDKKRAFFEKFKSISYNKTEDVFDFSFSYANFPVSVKLLEKKVWVVSSFGSRWVYSTKSKSNVKVLPTQVIKDALDSVSISFEHGQDILASLLDLDVALQSTKVLFDKLYQAFKAILQLRNNDGETGEDYIISPVKNSVNEYFDSRKYHMSSSLPCDSDANGAYNIARKGLVLIQQLKIQKLNNQKPNLAVQDADWFKYVIG